MGRSPCCSKEGLNRGAWTALEDKILTAYIKAHGEGKWRNLPKRAGLKRCGKSCRLRWLNYLRPDIKRGNISDDEEELIIRLHNLLGNRWSLIAGRLPGRTDNEIKNYWNTTLGKKMKTPKSPSSITSQQQKSPGDMEGNISKTSVGPQTQVIRTKATRATTKVLVPFSINENDDQINANYDDQRDFNYPSLEECPEEDLGNFFNFDCDEGELGQNRSFCFTQAMLELEDWTTTSEHCVDEHNNNINNGGGIDLDSLSFLLLDTDDQWT
ncbi:hypothetical protein ACFE04_016350 [Oxalis oulophora]